MLIFTKTQKPLPIGGVAGDEVHIWDHDLRVVDKLLLDDRFIDILARSFKRNIVGSTRLGRHGMALNQVLRTGVLKHICNYSFRKLYKELKRNLDARAFSQFFEEEIRSVETLSRKLALVDEQALREMNELLCKIARELGIIKGKALRQDTTVSESDIHYPTDSTLLRDGVRVLQRMTKRVEDLLPTFPISRDRSRAALHRVLEIERGARVKGDVGKQRREKAYRGLLRITRAVVTAATKATRRLSDGRTTRHLEMMDQLIAMALKDELETMVPRVEKVIRQTRARVLRGIPNSSDKLVSLFVPKTFVIRKGKPHKPNEFGRLIDIVEVENGFVSDYRVLDGNPSDGTLLIPALERHIERFNQPPHTIATDRGFWSAANEKAAYELGVKRVSIPIRGKVSKLRRRIQRSRWFRKAQRWRAGGEGRIGILKNNYQLDRCRYKGDMAMERWVGWCVFANNLIVVARVLRRQQDENDGAIETQRRSCQKAA
jgi:IS5 family transposase